MRYKVTLTRPSYQYIDLWLVAESADAAEADALRLAEQGVRGWEDGDDLGEAACIAVQEEGHPDREPGNDDGIEYADPRDEQDERRRP